MSSRTKQTSRVAEVEREHRHRDHRAVQDVEVYFGLDDARVPAVGELEWEAGN